MKKIILLCCVTYLAHYAQAAFDFKYLLDSLDASPKEEPKNEFDPELAKLFNNGQIDMTGFNLGTTSGDLVKAVVKKEKVSKKSKVSQKVPLKFTIKDLDPAALRIYSNFSGHHDPRKPCFSCEVDMLCGPADLDGLKKLMESKPDLNKPCSCKNQNGWRASHPPISIALMYARHKMVKYLIDMKADCDFLLFEIPVFNQGPTAGFYAGAFYSVCNRSFELTKLILERNANINVTDERGMTPYMSAKNLLKIIENNILDKDNRIHEAEEDVARKNGVEQFLGILENHYIEKFLPGIINFPIPLVKIIAQYNFVLHPNDTGIEFDINKVRAPKINNTVVLPSTYRTANILPDFANL